MRLELPDPFTPEGESLLLREYEKIPKYCKKYDKYDWPMEPPPIVVEPPVAVPPVVSHALDKDINLFSEHSFPLLESQKSLASFGTAPVSAYEATGTRELGSMDLRGDDLKTFEDPLVQRSSEVFTDAFGGDDIPDEEVLPPSKLNVHRHPSFDPFEFEHADNYRVAYSTHEPDREQLNPIFLDDDEEVSPTRQKPKRWWAASQPVVRPANLASLPKKPLVVEEEWVPELYDVDEEVLPESDSEDEYPINAPPPTASMMRPASSSPNKALVSPGNPFAVLPLRKVSVEETRQQQMSALLQNDIDAIRRGKERRMSQGLSRGPSSSSLLPLVMEFPPAESTTDVEHEPINYEEEYPVFAPLAKPYESSTDPVVSRHASQSSIMAKNGLVTSTKAPTPAPVVVSAPVDVASKPNMATLNKKPIKKAFTVDATPAPLLVSRTKPAANVNKTQAPSPLQAAASSDDNQRCTYLGNCTCKDCR